MGGLALAVNRRIGSGANRLCGVCRQAGGSVQEGADLQAWAGWPADRLRSDRPGWRVLAGRRIGSGANRSGWRDVTC